MARPTWEVVKGRIVLVGGTEKEREEAYQFAISNLLSTKLRIDYREGRPVSILSLTISI